MPKQQTDGSQPLFRVSESASEQIKRLMRLVPEEDRQSKYMPVVAWAVGGHEPDFVPGPIIGGFERALVPQNCTLKVDNFDLAYSFDDELAKSVQGKVLDFKDGRFLFRDGECVNVRY